MPKESLKESLKEILKEEIFSNNKNFQNENQQNETVASHLIGKICMFRTYSAGVHFGKLVQKNGQECLVENSRRVYYWAKACSLSQLAMEGDKDLDNCKIAMIVDEIVLDQVIEVIPMTKAAIDCLYGCSEWKV